MANDIDLTKDNTRGRCPGSEAFTITDGACPFGKYQHNDRGQSRRCHLRGGGKCWVIREIITGSID